MRHVAEAGRTTRLSTLLGAAVLTAAALTLTGCEVTETSGNYNAGPMCPANYNPVCAERRGEERTFSNACQARQSDWRIVSSGRCEATKYGDYRRDRDDRNRDSRNPDSRDSRRDNDRNRYDNQTPRDRNRPDRTQTPVRPNKPARPATVTGGCSSVIQPVCGQLGSKAQMFPNRCELLRSGAVEAAAGMCMGGDR
ncbi:Kazal-type serine protease inhibitor domain [Hoeflea sp. IMCC20628]|uniref:Kazal-type serine protease inhibitor family protein n=1 Tax=Hoeflea sp. IMCC20628 TaxID=1620421 RepID=UPI00063BD538|nr:Kazal-type serine protease inhibitor [Hoeflea sp. IMCC20628]AKI01319.1 Kazal-type serine protease inhibitor domain [Hoeflea sp. IMCC20628]